MAMVHLHRRLPAPDRYPLPPREITGALARCTGLDRRMSEEVGTAFTLANHFAYGAVCGGIYGVTLERVPAPWAARGMLLGGAVWSLSYLGLLPAVGALKPANRHPWRRNLLMLAVHALWGCLVAAFVQMARDERRDPLPALEKRSLLAHRDARK